MHGSFLVKDVEVRKLNYGIIRQQGCKVTYLLFRCVVSVPFRLLKKGGACNTQAAKIDKLDTSDLVPPKKAAPKKQKFWA
jgi:hypothetical protein